METKNIGLRGIEVADTRISILMAEKASSFTEDMIF